MMSRTFLIILLLMLWLAEFSLQVWDVPLNNQVRPIMWFISGLLFCGLSLWWLLRERGAENVRTDITRVEAWQRWLPWVVFLGGMMLAGRSLQGRFEEIPIDPYWSDIVPSIQLYVTRLLAGEPVYVPMEFPGWTVLPTYFPMMWLPYVPAEVFGFDYRWVAFGLFAIAVAVWVWHAARVGAGWISLTAFAGAPFVAVWLMAEGVRGQVFGMAVELMPVALYLLLALALLQKRLWLLALAIVGCLLSRYAFTFWLPVLFMVMLLEEGWWKTIRTGLIVAVGVGLLYVLPFLSRDLSILKNGLDYYHTTAVGQWHTQSFQSPGEKPHHLNQGFSFALYFYDFARGDVEDRLSLNRKVHMLASLLAAALLFVCTRLWRRRLQWRLTMLVGLKFYLTVFYGLFHVPFSYLYWLPLFLAFPVFVVILTPNKVKRG
jgi:hypothetical protein